MTHIRERWEGASICEKYTLEKWLGGDEGGAYFQTSLPPDGRGAVVKLVSEAVARGDGPLNLWHRIRQLRHPNLVELLDCGRADLDGEIAFYALFEAPDDTLTAALERGPLNQGDAREVLNSVIAALRYLHAQGLAAGALDADHIVAVGEQVKLSTGALREAETSAEYREDVRLLGEMWERSLMPATARSAELAAHAADPDDETRWTLAEISAALAAAYLEEPIVTPPPPPVTVVPEESPVSTSTITQADELPAAKPEAAISLPTISEADVSAGVSEAYAPGAVAASAAHLERPLAPAPVIEAETPAPPPAPRDAAASTHTPRRHVSKPPPAFGFPRWILIAAAGFFLFILAVRWLHPAKVATESKITPVSLPANSGASAASSGAPSPFPDTPPPRTAGRTPKTAVETAPKPAPRTEAQSGSSDESKIWRVIAFTYRTREAATKKADQLNEYHPGIDATVFAPKDDGRFYLVSLGGRMTREDAERVQRTARGRGLPRDLYVQNYTK